MTKFQISYDNYYMYLPSFLHEHMELDLHNNVT